MATTEPRHAFFETDEKVELNIFVKDTKPEGVEVDIEPRKVTFRYEDKLLILDPLRGNIQVEKSGFRVGKVKIEVWLAKSDATRWGGLTGEVPTVAAIVEPARTSDTTSTQTKKNWDILAKEALEKEGKDKTTSDDPNAGGDAAVNGFFQQIYASADEDTRRAMLKSYTESGGTSLSTDWKEVSKGKVEVKPPSGSEYKKF